MRAQHSKTDEQRDGWGGEQREEKKRDGWRGEQREEKKRAGKKWSGIWWGCNEVVNNV